MTELDTRLRALAAPGAPPIPPRELRRRAAGRRRRRHLVVAAAALVPVLAGVGVVVAVADDGPSRQEVVTDEGTAPPVMEPSTAATTGPPHVSTTSPIEPAETALGDPRVIGDVEGVTVAVSPREGLRDGDLVEVRVDGLDQLPEAMFWLCAGDVTAADVVFACSRASVQRPDIGSMLPDVESEQVVSVGRTIRITRGSPDPNHVAVAYDCALEPAGCALFVTSPVVPTRGVVVPLVFRDDPLPEAAIVLSSADGLADGEMVDATVTGLRPHAGFALRICTNDPTVCDLSELGIEYTFSDANGVLENPMHAWASIYGYSGRFDCTQVECALTVVDLDGTTHASTPISFAPDVVAPEPRLTVDPPGPYVDGQVVTVTGHGFRPGTEIGSELGQCPTGLDTAFEERCARPLAFQALPVDATGSFTATIELSSSLLFTGTCVGSPGCHLGWVLPHGTTVAVTPLEFSG